MEIDPTIAIEIKHNVWWLGWPDRDAGFSNNPYLIVEGEDVIIFDPGSRLDIHWNLVKKKIESVVPFNKITTVIVHHQDPDLCAAIPLIEAELGINNFEIITTDRTGIFIPYYDVKTEVTTISDGEIISFGEDKSRKLMFVTSPYLHFPGAVVTYDVKEKILFSSDIFGGFSTDWSLYANKYYFEAMSAFSQPYFPSKKHVHNFLDKIDQLDIDLIAPQHGSLIKRDLIPKAKEVLRNLEVGVWT